MAGNATIEIASLAAMSGTALAQLSCWKPYPRGSKGIYVALRMLNEQAEFARRMIESAREAPLDSAFVYWKR